MGEEFAHRPRGHVGTYAAVFAAAGAVVEARRARVVVKAAYLYGYTEELPEYADDDLVQYGEALTALADRRIAHSLTAGHTATGLTRDGLLTVGAMRQNEHRTAPHGAHTPPPEERTGEEGRPAAEGVGRATAQGQVEVRHHRRRTPA